MDLVSILNQLFTTEAIQTFETAIFDLSRKYGLIWVTTQYISKRPIKSWVSQLAEKLVQPESATPHRILPNIRSLKNVRVGVTEVSVPEFTVDELTPTPQQIASILEPSQLRPQRRWSRESLNEATVIRTQISAEDNQESQEQLLPQETVSKRLRHPRAELPHRRLGSGSGSQTGSSSKPLSSIVSLDEKPHMRQRNLLQVTNTDLCVSTYQDASLSLLPLRNDAKSKIHHKCLQKGPHRMGTGSVGWVDVFENQRDLSTNKDPGLTPLLLGGRNKEDKHGGPYGPILQRMFKLKHLDAGR